MTAVIMDEFAEAYAARLRLEFPQVEFLTGVNAAAVLPLMPRAKVLLGFAPWITSELIEAAPQLVWIQALTTGIDNLLNMTALAPGVMITTARGIHAPQMSELAFLYMLSLARDVRRMHANQADKLWHRAPQRLLHGSTLTIVGLGAIAAGLARRAKAFGMKVVGVTETERAIPDFDEVFARERLLEAVGCAAFVVVLTPYSERTHHLIDAEVLGAMRKDAFLVNLARGGVVDEVALLEALDAGAIEGAGLDVFNTEPLPESSAFWAHPRVLLTPHIGGMSDNYPEQVMPIITHNFAAFLAGRLGDLKNAAPRASQGHHQ